MSWIKFLKYHFFNKPFSKGPFFRGFFFQGTIFRGPFSQGFFSRIYKFVVCLAFSDSRAFKKIILLFEFSLRVWIGSSSVDDRVEGREATQWIPFRDSSSLATILQPLRTIPNDLHERIPPLYTTISKDTTVLECRVLIVQSIIDSSPQLITPQLQCHEASPQFPLFFLFFFSRSPMLSSTSVNYERCASS